MIMPRVEQDRDELPEQAEANEEGETTCERLAV
jgi:hypothetical protein